MTNTRDEIIARDYFDSGVKPRRKSFPARLAEAEKRFKRIRDLLQGIVNHGQTEMACAHCVERFNEALTLAKGDNENGR